jgi:hypothetical protein
MKVLVLNSTTINNEPYFKSKGIDCQYSYGSLQGIFPVIQTTSRPNEQGVMTDFYTPDVMAAVRNLILPLQYDEVVFCYNPADYDSRLVHTGGNTLGTDVYLGTQLSVVRLDGHEALYDMHEGVHRKTHKLQRLGYPVNDQMDMTLVHGVEIPYYKNEQPDATDGNYAVTWASIDPYITHLQEQVPVIKSSTAYSRWAFNLQLQLIALGYDVGIADGFFGKKTLGVIRAIQSSNGLVVDGIVGAKTLAVLHKKKV